MPAQAYKSRNQSLDVLRCIAVLMVVGLHYPAPYYSLWFRTGWAGVDLFFVLSGFLISGLLFSDYKANGRIDWKRFLIRRGFKIYPTYYFFLFLSTLTLYSSGSAVSLKSLAQNAFFAANYLGQPRLWPWAHLWSVAVEEHFYVALPILLVLLARRRVADPFRPILWLFPLIAATCLILRFTVNHDPYVHQTHLRFDSLFAGVTLGYLFHFRRAWFDKVGRWWALPAAALLIVPGLMAGPAPSEHVGAFSFAALYLGCALIVAWSVTRTPSNKVARSAMGAFARIGFFSYSIYIWHAIPAMLAAQFAPSAFHFWFYLAASLAFGSVMSKFVELPALAIREKFFPVLQAPVSVFRPGCGTRNLQAPARGAAVIEVI